MQNDYWDIIQQQESLIPLHGVCYMDHTTPSCFINGNMIYKFKQSCLSTFGMKHVKQNNWKALNLCRINYMLRERVCVST